MSTNSSGVGRPDKPLGRGLEEISHLFLSHRPNEAPVHEEPWSGPPAQASSQPAIPTRDIWLRARRGLGRARLAAALTEFDGALEAGMRHLDTDVPCDVAGQIDLMALDRGHRLTIIDFETTPGDGLMLRGIGHVDWAVRNVPTLRRMYQGQVINFEPGPRLFLVAPQFSPLLTMASRQVRPEVICVRYHVVDVFGGTGIFFEPVERA